MKNIDIFANKIEKEIIKIRHDLHKIPEIGFKLEKTYKYVFNKLVEYGYKPFKCGKCGIVATIGKGSKTILLRADMDALNIKEETNLDYKSINDNMHACGHDLHTSMLLGCAKILKKYEEELNGIVKLVFQPAEELLEGAKDMIKNGVLENPKVDAAIMIHVSSNTDLDTNKVVLAPSGIAAPSADYFTIEVIGVGSHGAMPELSKDPINVSAHIILALQQISSKEVSMSEKLVITIGIIKTSDVSNAIPSKVILKGTLRAYNQEIREYAKKRIKEISIHISKAFNNKAKVQFTSGCPCLYIDEKLNKFFYDNLKKLLKNDLVELDSISKNVGSEDFSYFTDVVPSIMINLSAGSKKEGYNYPLHHSKVCFNDDCLITGVKILTYLSIKYLK